MGVGCKIPPFIGDSRVSHCVPVTRLPGYAVAALCDDADCAEFKLWYVIRTNAPGIMNGPLNVEGWNYV